MGPSWKLGEVRVRFNAPILATVILAALVGVVYLAIGPLWAIAVLLGATFIGLSLQSYSWLITFVLVVRTYLDAYTDEYFYVGAVRISAAAVFSLVMTSLIIWSFIASRSLVPTSDGIKALALLILGSLIAVFTAYGRLGAEGNVALREIVRLLMLLVWYIFLYDRARKSKNADPFLRAVIFASAIPLVMGFVDLITGTKFDAEGATRISSTFVNPNSYGTYLVFLIMFAFARISDRNDWVGKLVLCLALPSLVLTYSRGAWIALMVAAPLYWVYVSKHRVKVSAAFVFVLLIAYPILAPRLSAVDYGDVITEAQTGMTSNSFSFRVMIWKELIKLWSQNPVLGWGLATTPTINPIRVVQDNRGFAAHNDAVRHLVETGLIGLLCYLNFLRVLGINLFRLSKRFVGTPLGSYALAAFATYVAIVVESFTVGDPLLESSFMFHFLGLAAILEGISHSAHSASGDEAGETPSKIMDTQEARVVIQSA